jgi:hypothetical protein
MHPLATHFWVLSIDAYYYSLVLIYFAASLVSFFSPFEQLV